MDTSIKFIKIEQLNLNKVKESTRVDNIIKSIYYWNNILL